MNYLNFDLKILYDFQPNTLCICSMLCSTLRHQLKMALRFKEFLATRFTIVLMEQLAAWVTMESINAVQLLTLFVAKTEFPVAAMEQLAVPHLVAVLNLMLFVVKTAAVAPMEKNVLEEGGPVQMAHNFCPEKR